MEQEEAVRLLRALCNGKGSEEMTALGWEENFYLAHALNNEIIDVSWELKEMSNRIKSYLLAESPNTLVQIMQSRKDGLLVRLKELQNIVWEGLK